MTAADRPPPFIRRHTSNVAADPDILVGLACDENYWVRRQAVNNPATPAWVMDLLIRAGADARLRGRAESDPTMGAADLRTLVECGPFAQELVAAHPNTDREVLSVLATQSSRRLRTAVARHHHTGAATLASLCADREESVREAASQNANTPIRVLELRTEGSPALPDYESFGELAALGPWARFLAARHPGCPIDLLEAVAGDPDWRIRSGLLDNPNAPPDLVTRVVGDDHSELVAALHADPSDPGSLDRLADHPSIEVRLAVARHPGTASATLGRLAADESAEIRRQSARHPQRDDEVIELLIRAGSSPDLVALADPDPSVSAAELDGLVGGGQWARMLAVRHPNTSAETLSRLLCDADPRIREWAGAHQSAPTDVIAQIIRAGGADDFQGMATPDPEMNETELRAVADLGPWGQWLVSWHPNAPRDLLRTHRDDR